MRPLLTIPSNGNKRLAIKDIINKHKNQKCLLIGHGPSLNDYLDKLVQMKNDYVILGCSEWPVFHSHCVPSYWFIANSVQTVHSSLEEINFYRPILIYSDTVDLTNYSFLKNNLQTDWLPFGHAPSGIWLPLNHPRHKINKNRLTIQEEYQKYTKFPFKYGTGSTVALHMMSFSVLMGFTEINFIGFDFNYHIGDGYAKNKFGLVPVEPHHFDLYRSEILNDMKIIVESAKFFNPTIKFFNLSKIGYK